MAKRSDFAQKLLDDLRLRKERMNASSSSQTSNHSNTLAIDAYAYSKQSYRGGSRDTKTQGTIATRTRNSHTIHSGSSRSYINNDTSNQIVSYNQGRNNEQIGDLSMALAFALENGGKLQRTDSSRNNPLLSFLHQIGGRTMNLGKMEKRSSNSPFPTLSHLHIKEISKGAQKLNQILRACSNGLNFDRHSIEIGKELLKGAMDLEESLRMLVNLQEASEYMITPQKRNRIVLLDDDDDDEENKIQTPERKQLDLPRFSFDKFSRHSHSIKEVKRNYTTGDTKYLNCKEQAMIPSNSVSHRLSASYDHDIKKNHGNSLKAKPEKARISNVVAKLMGLDDLPHSKNTAKQHSVSKQNDVAGIDIHRTERQNTKKAEPKTVNTLESVAYSKSRKLIEANKNPTTFMLQPTKISHTRSASLESIRFNERPPWRDSDGIKTVTGSAKATIKIDKQQSNIEKVSQNIASQKGYHGRESNKDKVKQREQKVIEKGESTGQVFNNSLQKKSEPGNTFQEKMGYKRSIVQLEKRVANKLGPKYQQKTTKVQEVMQNVEEKEKQSGKHKLQERNEKGIEWMSKLTSKPVNDTINLRKKHPNANGVTQDKKICNDLNLTTNDLTNRALDQSPYPKVRESEHGNEKALIAPATPKAKIEKIEAPQKINEIITRKSGAISNLGRPVKQQNSILVEVKRRRHDKRNEYDGEEVIAGGAGKVVAEIIEFKKSVESTEPLNVTQELHKKTEQVSTLHYPGGEEFQSLEGSQIQAPKESVMQHQKRISTVTGNQRDPVPVYGGDKELNRLKTISNTVNETGKGSTYISPPTQSEQVGNFPKSRKQRPLTESENHLKQILITSELFMNTAEALFKLNIPISILHYSNHDSQDQDDRNLILDFSYEVMKRKAKRQELVSIHPWMNISMKYFTKIRSLDGLVEQLNEDFEKLKVYGRNEKRECKVEDYLPRMIENDIFNRHSDLNCMWDLGWREGLFGFLEIDDVVKDVEKYVLNGVIDELIRDVLYL